MKRLAVAGLLLFFSGCAAYKELSPEPPVLPAERGYIEIKNKSDNFLLERDKKYYIEFPAPPGDNFFLVLRTTIKPILTSYLASSFNDGAPVSARVADEMAKNDSLYAFKVERAGHSYYWLIDAVQNDAELTLRYRYVPQWRFTFEMRYATLRDMLASNRTDPTFYNSIGPGTTFDAINVPQELSAVERRLGHLKDGQTEIQSLAQLFPPNIAATRDTAYDNYLLLKSDLGDEVMLQENYASVLRVVDKLNTSRGNTGAFLSAAPTFLDFLNTKEHQRRPVVDRISTMLTGPLADAGNFYDGLLRAKSDDSKFEPTPPIDNALNLYKALGVQVPAKLVSVVGFAERYNMERSALSAVEAKMSDMDKLVQKESPWASEELYRDLLARLAAARAAMPSSNLAMFDERGQYTCARALTALIDRTSAKINALQDLYQQASGLLGDINAGLWANAERRDRDLALSPNFNGVPAALVQQRAIVKQLDGELFTRVKRGTEQRVDAFVQRNTSTIDNINLLYQDSAFTPVYDLKFAAGGEEQLRLRRKEIADYLADARHVRFPGAAIKQLYAEFVRDPGNRGVDHARAITLHGKEYTGSDKQITGMVNECDVESAKWIVRPKEYRKVYALPVTSNLHGDNEYMFRVRLQIPTEAEFPVYDVHVKLPVEIAEKAGSASWYRSITIDKVPIRNEGRFRITAPTKDNNYESLITPVQMDREGKHILEIRFSYPGYRVFEVSTLAQIPIIRKN